LRSLQIAYTDGSHSIASQRRATSEYSTEPYIHARELYIESKEPYVHAKEPYVHAKEPYVHAKELSIDSKEQYIESKKPYVHAIEVYILYRLKRALCTQLFSSNDPIYTGLQVPPIYMYI